MEILQANLLSPLTLAFALGVTARLIKSEFSLPKDVYTALSVFLLFSLGLKGGVELGHASLGVVGWPIAATLALGVLTPVSAYAVLRGLGRFSVADAAGIAAHYGSVSAVTYLAALTFVKGMNAEAEGFMPTLLTLLESPGIHVALAIGAIKTARPGQSLKAVLHEVLTARTMVLLVGGLLIGVLMGEKHWASIEGFFDTRGPVFKGALMLFLLEMGVVAGARLADLRKVGPFLVGFGVTMPIVHGAVGVWLGTLAGLSVGGATVLGAMAASASYIAAPPAVRITLPEANPTYYLTAALAITFPFNILLGIPLYFRVSQALHGS
ncbi:MAG: sodium-dependent bicarbonate transport family permease [Myxococcota bacterium]